MKAVIVTWEAGGGAQVAIGLGRLLAERGHDVRIFAPASAAGRVATAGCLHLPLPPEAELDPARRAEQQRDVLERIFHGPEFANAVAAEVTADHADVILVDYLLRSVASVAEQLPAADVLLIHTIYRFHGGAGEDDDARRRWYEPVNAARRRLGLDELPVEDDSVTVALTRRATGVLVAVPREFDDWEDPPANVVHMGPIVEKPSGTPWIAPWPPEDERPLVVVSLGSQYMHQEDVLRRTSRVLGQMPVRALILSGAVSPAQIQSHPNTAIESYVPHDAVLPGASVVVTHAGTGTLLAAFAAGVPVLCVPLGRDQPQNASRVAQLGLGRVISVDASGEEIRQALTQLLESPDYRRNVASMRASIESYAGGEPGVRMLERLS